MSNVNEILTINNLQGFSIQEFIELLKDKKTLSVQLSEQEIIVLEISQKLKPLPIVEGYVPSGWKSAIYEN
ncbi:conserved hypothetical protein [Planktothrix serta PCC 8927]|uniref:Uncharacterized protein n=1 Tax=Planktothrix serta PCC 8927 TaxID=671068 RepID=A0A7Z9C0U2_9CYAN|nr:hypothetical protein [Planktothrix serta]VXD23045.1 conserved hypothetical protein [Planktothrix serta PCC 8927]